MIDWSVVIATFHVIDWIIRIGAVFIVPRNRKPTSGISWLLIIFLLPIIGIILFFILSSPKLPPIRRKAQQVINQYVVQVLEAAKLQFPRHRAVLDAKVDAEHEPIARLASNLTGLSVVGGNSVDVLTDYLGIIDRIIKDIRRAQRYVYVEFYALALDDTTEPVFKALEEAVERGVLVRVLYDQYGSMKYPNYRAMKRRLKNSGIIALPMLPLRLPGFGYVRPDLRNHRKLVIIDGEIGYTGSLNMIERGYHRKDSIVYDELMVRMQGLIVVQLRSVFTADWFAETGDLLGTDPISPPSPAMYQVGELRAQIVPSGPSYDYENNLEVFVQLFSTARQSITIVNPYFVPNEALEKALVSATQRGVKVTLVNSEAVDQLFVAHAQSSYYDEMLRAGVEIYHYKAPTLLHSKYMVVDDISLVGSSNVDIRSFELNHELVALFYDKVVARKLSRITEAYLERAKRLRYEKWRQRAWYKQLLDNIARLTSSLQ